MAKDLSLSPSTLSRFFGNRNLINSEKLLSILKYLDIDVSELLSAKISSKISNAKHNTEVKNDIKLISDLILNTDDIDRKILIKNLERSISITKDNYGN